MMIDFALEAERKEKKDSRAAIRETCLLRFRPIMMTTTAAMFGAAARARHGSGQRASPSPRHRHRRRPDRQPNADALHHEGDLLYLDRLRSWRKRRAPKKSRRLHRPGVDQWRRER